MKIDGNIANISSGLRINNAADDAAGLSISEKMKAQESGNVVAANNAEQSRDALNTAEGSLDGISDGLMRIRELAVHASNGILTDNDKKGIQEEINQIKSQIQDQAQNTEFNGIKLLDGTFENRNAGNANNGQGSIMNIKSTTLESLGIEDFDVTGEFNVSDIDNAITTVNDARSTVGAQTNALERSATNLRVAAENTLSARSRIQDSDIAEEISKLRRNQTLDQVKLMTQQIQQKRDEETTKTGFSMIL